MATNQTTTTAVQTFDWKVMAFRVFTAAYTAFLGAFTASYSLSPNVATALHSGEAACIAAIAGAFGLDQLVYHYGKTNAEVTTQSVKTK